MALSVASSLYSLSASNESAINALIVGQIQSYPKRVEDLKRFLVSFRSDKSLCDDPEVASSETEQRKYVRMLQRILDGELSVVKIELEDVDSFFHGDLIAGQKHYAGKNETGLASISGEIEANVQRYKQLFYEAAHWVMSTHCVASSRNAKEVPSLRLDKRRCGGDLEKMREAKVPVFLRANYEIRFASLRRCSPTQQKEQVLSVRDIKAIHVGALVKLECLVVKVSSVKPRLAIAYYKCLYCDADVYQPVEDYTYTPLLYCQSQACTNSEKRGELKLVISKSKMIKYQEVKVQEPTRLVPMGSIPRTLKVIVEGSLTRLLLPGMVVTLAGFLTPLTRSLAKSFAHWSRRRGGAFLTETVFQVEEIEVLKKGHREIDCNLRGQEEELEKKIVEKYENVPDIYSLMSRSILPSIHGMDDVKKALLLQLVGGVTKIFPDGMRLRGDIHILLMGDPGMAKSQLLAQTCWLSERGYYTTGKGTSGVGLTASVIRDSATGDFALEGGALVLADKGICCIDEFDKLDEYDRTAIHEIMEQQTVSISKAGLTTTLNARTSLLAAANPQYGRYDVRKSPLQNINLPSALLSRFDICFLILDEPDMKKDTELAYHVLRVHQAASNQAGGATFARGPESNPGASNPAGEANATRGAESNPGAEGGEPLPPEIIRILIRRAKTYSPFIPEHLVDEIVEYYVESRQKERREKSQNEHNSYTTPRTLLALLRLSQALCRLRFSSSLDRGDFEEAVRLIVESKKAVLDRRTRNRNSSEHLDYKSAILELLKSINVKNCDSPGYLGWMEISEVENSLICKGFSRRQLLETIEVYVEIDLHVHHLE